MIRKYLIVLIITAFIFFSTLYISNYFNEKRLSEIRDIENKIAIDILSLETQFDLLSQSSCRDIAESFLSQELNSLARRLTYTEEQLGTENPEVVRLKTYYSLLQVKDFLLMQKIADRCDTRPVSVIYFYSNTGDCPDCQREGFVLTHLRETYPTLRVYAFDYHLDVPAVSTLKQIYKLRGDLPAIVAKEKPYYGYQSVEDIEKILPELAKLATSTPSSTDNTSGH